MDVLGVTIKILNDKGKYYVVKNSICQIYLNKQLNEGHMRFSNNQSNAA